MGKQDRNVLSVLPAGSGVSRSSFGGRWPSSAGGGVPAASGSLAGRRHLSLDPPFLAVPSADWLTLWGVEVSLHVLCPPSLTSRCPSVEGNRVWVTPTSPPVCLFWRARSASLRLLPVLLAARAGRLSTLGLAAWG